MTFNFKAEFLAVAAARRYFHGSSRAFQPGAILGPGNLQSWGFSQEHEQIFEQARPSDKVPRIKCVFMCSRIQDVNQAGGGSLIYEVQPLGQVDVSDQAWYGMVGAPETGMGYTLKDPDTFDMVMNYWEGVPYPDKSESLWEYRTPSAKVLRRVK